MSRSLLGSTHRNDDGASEPTPSGEPDARGPVGWSAPDWRIVLGLVGFEGLLLALHGLRGPNFVLDDYWILEQGVFDGVLGASDHSLTAARPGTPVAYGATFGLFGNHPLPIFLVQAAIMLGVVVALYAALRRFLDRVPAAATVAVWIYLPNHMSLEVWTTTSIIALSLLFLALGVWAVARPDPGRGMQVLSLVCFGLAAVFYEASIPTASALVVLVPVLVERRIRWGFVAAGAAVLGACTLWLVTHWHSVKHVSTELADLSQMVPAHFGWGAVGTTVGPVLVGLVGAAVVVVLVGAVRNRAIDQPTRMVVAGIGFLVLGTLPFATYFYAPLGAGDRFNYISSVGGALVLVGVGIGLWRYRALVVAGALLIVVAGGVTRWQRTLIWDQAGDDAVAIVAEVQRQIPEPDGVIAIGPAPIQRENVGAFIDHSNINGALRVAYGDRSVSAVITFSEEDFLTYDPDHRVDIREVSGLEPDAVVTPGD